MRLPFARIGTEGVRKQGEGDTAAWHVEAGGLRDGYLRGEHRRHVALRKMTSVVACNVTFLASQRTRLMQLTLYKSSDDLRWLDVCDFVWQRDAPMTARRWPHHALAAVRDGRVDHVDAA